MAPRTPLEELLAGIWTEVLGLTAVAGSAPSPVGIHDSFFELGGHSLLATQVAARVSAACGIDLPVGALFDVHTIAQLAVVVAQRMAEQVADDDLEQLLEALENLPGAEGINQ